ncbi:MAG: SPOR domain-containing protein [Proteobacteria bacterium]|nr:SPOR domain-containing protein [Pseudomonadota bacterium]
MPKQEKFVAVDPGVKKLVLLSEQDVENTIWEGQEAQMDETQMDKQDKQQTAFNQECYTAGVFNAKSEIQPILDALKNSVLKIRTRKVISTQEVGYWVYIPALKSRQEALSIGRKLSENAIEDYYVVTVGENENTISLGLYRDSINADARLQELISRGFNAEKQIKVEQWPEFWLDYAIASDQIENLADITEINPDIATNQVKCNW